MKPKRLMSIEFGKDFSDQQKWKKKELVKNSDTVSLLFWHDTRLVVFFFLLKI